MNDLKHSVHFLLAVGQCLPAKQMCAKREREKITPVCGSVVVFAGGGVGLVGLILALWWEYLIQYTIG